MADRPIAAVAASLVLLASLALLSASARGGTRTVELDSTDMQPIFSLSSDTNPNAGWNDPYGRDGVLKRASGFDDALGHEGRLNDDRVVNEDSVPTYDHIVQGQFNHKMHLPFHSLVAQVSRFRLPPAPPTAVKGAMANFYRNIAASAAGIEEGKRAVVVAKAVEASVKVKPLTAAQRKAAEVAAAKAAATARLYRRLWREQGTDYTALPRGSKVNLFALNQNQNALKIETELRSSIAAF
jgi:hypothetical protein